LDGTTNNLLAVSGDGAESGKDGVSAEHTEVHMGEYSNIADASVATFAELR
jgi:hypothetical protein